MKNVLYFKKGEFFSLILYKDMTFELLHNKNNYFQELETELTDHEKTQLINKILEE